MDGNPLANRTLHGMPSVSITSGDPSRPMQLYWRLYAGGAGRQLLIEMGSPSAGAPPSLKGFIALYVLSA